MTNTVSSETDESRLASLSTAGKIRLGAFTLVALAIIALNFVMTPADLLLAAINGWGRDLGDHQVHEMVVSALIWLAFVVPMALLVYHPSRRVNTILAPFVLAIPTAVMALLADSFLFTGFVIMSVLAVLALLLHPAGRSLVWFDRVESIDRRVAGLFTLGGLPLLVYAGLEVANQLGPVDEHVLFVHYGAMAIAAFLVILMGILGIARQRDWRFATWSSGVMAAFLGFVSVVYPGSRSSLGVIGGILLVLWAIAFVASVERVRRDEVDGTESRNETVVRSSSERTE